MAENKNNGASDSTERSRGAVGAATAAGEPPLDVVERPADPAADAFALAEEAEAEAAEAEALAAAARARARAMRLRRQAQSQVSNVSAGDEREAVPEVVEPAAVSAGVAEADAATEEASGEAVRSADGVADKPEQGRRGRRVSALVALVCTAVLICGLLTASGFMVWRHREAVADRHRTAEYVAAARQGVVSLFSLDFNHAKADVQRIIDNSTGQFRDDFSGRADDFAKVMQDSKVVTTSTVNAAAVQSMSGNSAVVLVSATSQVSNATGAHNETRVWRLAVTVTNDGGQMKMSKVEFVP